MITLLFMFFNERQKKSCTYFLRAMHRYNFHSKFLVCVLFLVLWDCITLIKVFRLHLYLCWLKINRDWIKLFSNLRTHRFSGAFRYNTTQLKRRTCKYRWRRKMKKFSAAAGFMVLLQSSSTVTIKNLTRKQRKMLLPSIFLCFNARNP